MKTVSFVELLKCERSELALLSTYNFEPVFFEMSLLRSRALAEARRIVVFVDASEWSRTETTRVRGLNCRYLVVPIRRKRGVFHPKLTLLLGATSASIICASANLSRAGCTHNLELLNALPFSFDEKTGIPEQAHLIGDALAFFRECTDLAQEGVRTLLGEWLDELPVSLPWLPGVLASKPVPDGFQLCHTLKNSLWSVIRSELEGHSPRFVRVLSPFYDDDLALAARIRKEWPGCRVEITAQQNTSTVPVEALVALGAKVSLHELRGAGSRRLHAKLCTFEHAKGTIFVAGSANFTLAAFDGRNVETCLVWHERKTRFDDLFDGKITRRAIAAKNFEPGKETPPEKRESTTTNGWELYSAILGSDDRLRFQFGPIPPGSGNVVAELYVESEENPILAVPISTNARDSGECHINSNQSDLLCGPVRCELRIDENTSSSAWLVQESRLTREVSGSDDRSSERERLIQETGSGLLEKLAELGRTDGLSAIIEYLNRLNIRYKDEGESPRRPFSAKPRDPFSRDELPAWLLLSPELRKSYGAAVCEFVERHEHRIFRAHARRPSLGGLANFQDVMLTVAGLLYDAFVTGDVAWPYVVGKLCRALEIFGFGFETQNDACDGYTAGLLENLIGSQTQITDAFREKNTLATLRVVLLAAQRARAQLHHSDVGVPYPLESAQEKFTRMLSEFRWKAPSKDKLEAALQALKILTTDQITIWLAPF